MTSAIINALLDNDDDDEHNISRVYSSAAARLDLGESARCCDSASLQPLRQHNLDCVRNRWTDPTATDVPSVCHSLCASTI